MRLDTVGALPKRTHGRFVPAMLAQQAGAALHEGERAFRSVERKVCEGGEEEGAQLPERRQRGELLVVRLHRAERLLLHGRDPRRSVLGWVGSASRATPASAAASTAVALASTAPAGAGTAVRTDGEVGLTARTLLPTSVACLGALVTVRLTSCICLL